jgi:hypothetical protein
MHHGVDYPCTGHAHYAGQHIECTNPVHAQQPTVEPAKAIRNAAHWSPTIALLADPTREGS